MEPNNHLSDNIKDIAPTLYKMKKENPFSVPDNYFESLPALIQEQCIQTKKAPWYKGLLNPKISISLGCLIVSLAIGVLYYSNYLATKPDTLMASNIELDSIPIEDLDESSLIELVIDREANNDDEKTAFEDYLIEHNIDIYQIITEL